MDLLFIILLLVCGMALIILELVAIPGTTIAGLAGVGLSIWGIYRVFVEFCVTIISKSISIKCYALSGGGFFVEMWFE